MSRLLALVLVSLLPCLGCLRAGSPTARPGAADAPPAQPMDQTTSAGAGKGAQDTSRLASRSDIGGEQVAKAEGPADKQEAPPARGQPEAGQPAKELPRKIKYTADVQLVVEDFDEAQAGLVKLVADHKGYVA